MRSIEDDQCQVCWCYCFSSPHPWPWKNIETKAGLLRVCADCFDRFDGKNIDDPKLHYMRSSLHVRLVAAEKELELCESELDRLDFGDSDA